MSATKPAAKKSWHRSLTEEPLNDESRWDSKLAWRTPWITTYSLILAFCVVPAQCDRAEADASRLFNLDKSQLYWLTALPGLAACILCFHLHVPAPVIGTRGRGHHLPAVYHPRWLGWFYVVQDNTTPYWSC